jgi:eukaryotic-like serine/threonine-protein kinase
MKPSRARETGMRSEMRAALDVESLKLDLLVSRVWQLVALLGLIGALTVAATWSRRIGLVVAVVAIASLGWFSLAVYLANEGKLGRRFTIASTVFESAIPWICMVLLIAVQGSVYALGSWLPPMLFTGVLVGQLARLRQLPTILVGISSAIAFIAIYYLLARGHMTPEVANEPLNRASTQITRTFTLALSGVLSALVARGLRGLIGRAESNVRAKDLFGKYRVVRQIASGGMGTVHEALYCPEGGFERRVAMKRIHPHLAEQEKFVDEFRREAELSARLVHANIVQVFDFGRVEDTYFLAMEYVDGLTLLRFMGRLRSEKRAIPETVVAHVARELLTGLDYSHAGARASDGSALRIIHRDLSPANVLLARTGEVKISDFGLARALRDAASTRTRTVAGHVGYMAPEQARGEALDERCDLFGLGVIIWELLAGRRLFARDSETATLFALMMEPIAPIGAARPDLDPRWDEFLLRAMAREPRERYPSASEMRSALDEICRGEGRREIEVLRELIELALRAPARPAGEEPETVALPTSARVT